MNNSNIETLSKRVSCHELLRIIGSEVGIPYNNSCPKSVAMARLHCGAWLNDDPQETSLNDYVRTGITSMKVISTNSEDEIGKINYEMEELSCMGEKEDDIEFLERVIDWVNAISHRADSIDTVEMVLAMTEEWADYNGIDLQPAE
jgi:hypothetical protein